MSRINQNDNCSGRTVGTSNIQKMDIFFIIIVVVAVFHLRFKNDWAREKFTSAVFFIRYVFHVILMCTV